MPQILDYWPAKHARRLVFNVVQQDRYVSSQIETVDAVGDAFVQGPEVLSVSSVGWLTHLVLPGLAQRHHQPRPPSRFVKLHTYLAVRH